MMRPPAMAPGTEVKPPRIRTGNAFSAISERLNCTPLLAPHMMPATMATRPATDHTTVQIVRSGMPSDSAASWSSATARSARPIAVFWKNTASTVTRTAAVIAAVSSSRLTRTLPILNEASGMPTSRRLTLAPHSISPKPSRKKFRPMVAMNRMMCSWFTRGRSTTRSMAKASRTITPTVSRSATATGAPRSMRPTSVSAAKSTMTPWAKLNTPEALKISTNPSATSEYMRPAATPPMSTSAKKLGLEAMSANGATSPPRTSLMRDPEVGVEHGLVLAHLLGRAVGDLAPVVEHDHAVGDVHDHAHVVLDERHGGAELGVDVEDEAAHVFLLLDVHAGHGLVQQQQLRLGRQRTGQLHALLQAVGQLAGRRLADGLDLEEVDDALDEGAVGQLLPAGRPPPERVGDDVAAHLEQPARHDVVEHAHALEERDVLERPGDAQRGHVGRGQVRAVAAGEADRALVGMVEAADDVEQRGLAGAVGPDDRQELAALDDHAHLVQRQQRAEADADAVHLQQRARGGRPGHGAPAPTSQMRTSARIVPVRPSS